MASLLLLLLRNGCRRESFLSWRFVAVTAIQEFNLLIQETIMTQVNSRQTPSPRFVPAGDATQVSTATSGPRARRVGQPLATAQDAFIASDAGAGRQGNRFLQGAGQGFQGIVDNVGDTIDNVRDRIDHAQHRFGLLSDAEKTFLRNNPHLLGPLNKATDRTVEIGEERGFGRNVFTDNGGNSFRHALWNALMTRELFKSDRRPFTSNETKLADALRKTEEYATAHEDTPKSSGLPKEMDLHNNHLGREIAGRILRENPNATEDQLADAIEFAMKDGALVMVDNGQLTHSTDPR